MAEGAALEKRFTFIVTWVRIPPSPPTPKQTAELVIYPTKEMVGRIKIPLYLSRSYLRDYKPFAKGRQYYISIEIGEGLVLYQHSPKGKQ